jgi:hypothetical protein
MSLSIDSAPVASASGDLLDVLTNLSPGTHHATITGKDAAGSFSNTFTIYTSANERPKSLACGASEGVYICSPAAESTLYNAIEISASASTLNGRIIAMILYVDGARYYRASSHYYAPSHMDVTLRIPAGRHRLTVKAWNGSGQVYSKTVYVTIRNYF